MGPHALTATLPRARIVRGIAAFVGMGALLYLGAIVWSGSAQTFASLAAIGAGTMLAGTAIASVCYFVRFARWHAILARLGHRLPVGFDLRVYLAGLALTTSPGKLGETIRSALLLPRGVPIPHSLAAFFGDRLSDVIGVALLGAVAGWVAGYRQPVLEALAVIVFVGSFVAAWIAGSARLGRAIGAAGPRGQGRVDGVTGTGRVDAPHAVGAPDAPDAARAGGNRIARILTAAAAPAPAWARTWSLPRVIAYVAAAFVAYGTQASAFALYAGTVAPELDPIRCVAIFASATLLGAASMIPGGLGAMEAALVYQLADAGLALPDAIAVAFATRASTLWFAILLGSTMLLGLAGGHAVEAPGAPGREP
jgi:uncharacterized membrane protein YbhN (UPF0104 family)